MWQNAKAISLGVSQLTLLKRYSSYWLLAKGSRIQGRCDWPLDTSRWKAACLVEGDCIGEDASCYFFRSTNVVIGLSGWLGLFPLHHHVWMTLSFGTENSSKHTNISTMWNVNSMLDSRVQCSRLHCNCKGNRIETWLWISCAVLGIITVVFVSCMYY